MNNNTYRAGTMDAPALLFTILLPYCSTALLLYCFTALLVYSMPRMMLMTAVTSITFTSLVWFTSAASTLNGEGLLPKI